MPARASTSSTCASPGVQNRPDRRKLIPQTKCPVASRNRPASAWHRPLPRRRPQPGAFAEFLKHPAIRASPTSPAACQAWSSEIDPKVQSTEGFVETAHPCGMRRLLCGVLELLLAGFLHRRLRRGLGGGGCRQGLVDHLIEVAHAIGNLYVGRSLLCSVTIQTAGVAFTTRHRMPRCVSGLDSAASLPCGSMRKGRKCGGQRQTSR